MILYNIRILQKLRAFSFYFHLFRIILAIQYAISKLQMEELNICSLETRESDTQ